MRFFPLLLVFAAICCAVRADWLSWSGGGQSGLTAIARETGNSSSYALGGWSPKPTVAPDAVAPEGKRVLELLERGATTSNWTNAQTCGWISGSQSSSFGCNDNGTCVTNEDHIVACATGTYSPFYSMCLNYDAYKSGSCKNDDSSTGCCMDSDYPECVTYLWVDPPQRSMYRCWKSSALITMLDEPEEVQDHPTHSATSSETPLMDGTSDSPTQEDSKQDTISNDVVIVLTVAGGLGVIYLLYVFIRNWRLRRAVRRRNEEEGIALGPYHFLNDGHESTDGKGQPVVNGPVLDRYVSPRVPDATVRPHVDRTHEVIRSPLPKDYSRVHSRNHRGQLRLEHLNPTSSTAAMYGSSPTGPPSYVANTQNLANPRRRAPGGTYTEAMAVATGRPYATEGSNSHAEASPMEVGTSRRIRTPPPTYQEGFQSDSTLGFSNMVSYGTLSNGFGRDESNPNWIELSRSSPTLPAATRRDTRWPLPPVTNEAIAESSTWQDVSGSVLTAEGDETLRSEDDAYNATGGEGGQAVFGTTRRGVD
ncbi:hypothetical protein F4805DRAFT_105999 [Annulohypoxylon moriforme]|nr:hypothetical protein F4805DRAFT_105999 [Annulohypoxylon moriforme]